LEWKVLFFEKGVGVFTENLQLPGVMLDLFVGGPEIFRRQLRVLGTALGFVFHFEFFL
jgi:hypothetical protein